MSRLIEARERTGMTIKDAAGKIGVHPTILARMEQGGLERYIKSTEELALIYGVSKYWLMGWSEDDREVVEKIKAIDGNERIKELERENAYLQRLLQSREYALSLIPKWRESE